MRAAAFLLAVALTGCIQIGGDSDRPETVTVTHPPAPAPTPTGPPTYLKLNVIFNKMGQHLTVQAQAYDLDSQGNPSYTGYNIRALLVTANVRNEYPNQAEWVPCNDKMEGIRIKWLDDESDVRGAAIWSGIHCYGNAKQYHLTIDEEGEMFFGSYTGTLATPTVKPRAPSISFNKDSADGTLTVIQAESADWSDFYFNGACQASKPTSGAVKAGDMVSITAGRPCTVKIMHRPSNSLVYETTFT